MKDAKVRRDAWWDKISDMEKKEHEFKAEVKVFALMQRNFILKTKKRI